MGLIKKEKRMDEREEKEYDELYYKQDEFLEFGRKIMNFDDFWNSLDEIVEETEEELDELEELDRVDREREKC